MESDQRRPGMPFPEKYRADRLYLYTRKASAIITPEDFIYVKRDLIRIGILSSIMIAALIVLTFIIGVG